MWAGRLHSLRKSWVGQGRRIMEFSEWGSEGVTNLDLGLLGCVVVSALIMLIVWLKYR